MNFINSFHIFNEAVNFFEKGKFWSIGGKKVKVVGSIPQNPKVLKLQEVDENDKPIGKVFVGNKGEVKGFKQSRERIKPTSSETPEQSTSSSDEQSVDKSENPEIEKRYKELISDWKESQRKISKNTSPGEGTRNRLRKQAQSEVNFDETTDVDKDLKLLKTRPASEVVDRLTSLVRSKKVKDTKNILKYLEFTKSKIQIGNISQPSMN